MTIELVLALILLDCMHTGILAALEPAAGIPKLNLVHVTETCSPTVSWILSDDYSRSVGGKACGPVLYSLPTSRGSSCALPSNCTHVGELILRTISAFTDGHCKNTVETLIIPLRRSSATVIASIVKPTYRFHALVVVKQLVISHVHYASPPIARALSKYSDVCCT